MDETNHHQTSTPDAENTGELRTQCGLEITGTVHHSIGFRSEREAIERLCLKVFGATPVYPDRVPVFTGHDPSQPAPALPEVADVSGLPTEQGWHWIKDRIGQWRAIWIQRQTDGALWACIPKSGAGDDDWWQRVEEVRGVWGSRIADPDQPAPAPSDAVKGFVNHMLDSVREGQKAVAEAVRGENAPPPSEPCDMRHCPVCKPKAPSATPRTDANVEICNDSSNEFDGEWVNSDFARTLERELAAAIRERDRLSEELAEARNIAAELRNLVPWSESEPWNFSWENAAVKAEPDAPTAPMIPQPEKGRRS